VYMGVWHYIHKLDKDASSISYRLFDYSHYRRIRGV
jgi:hypothetical protein